MMALRFLGSVELAGRGISSPLIIEKYFLWYTIPTVLALAALFAEKRSRRLGHSLGWAAIIGPVLVALVLESPSSFLSLFYFVMMLVVVVVLFLVVMGVNQDWASYWGVLGLSFLLGIVLSIRGASGLCLATRLPGMLLCLSAFFTVLSGPLMMLALLLGVAGRAETSLVLSGSATLLFTGFLLHYLHGLLTVEARYLYFGFYGQIVVLVIAVVISAITLSGLVRDHLHQNRQPGKPTAP
jgi:hypothetical protein